MIQTQFIIHVAIIINGAKWRVWIPKGRANAIFYKLLTNGTIYQCGMKIELIMKCIKQEIVKTHIASP